MCRGVGGVSYHLMPAGISSNSAGDPDQDDVKSWTGSARIHAADKMTSVMPEMKLIHILDSDLDHLMPEEFQLDFNLA